MKNKIILTSDTDLIDKEAREWMSQLSTRIDTINERTKNHTVYFREFERKLKELEKKIKELEKR